MTRSRRLRRSREDRLPVTQIDKVFQTYRAGDLAKLCQAARQLTEITGFSNKTMSWCRFVFELIATSGICGPDYLDEILDLQYRHLDSVADGLITIPRAGGEYPIFIPRSTILAGISIRVHLSRGRGQGRNRIGRYLGNGYLIPGKEGDETRPLSQADRKTTWKVFRDWLSSVASRVDLRITPNQLAALSRALALQAGSPPIIACLMGVHLVNPVPVEQLPDIASFRTAFIIYRPIRLDSTHRSMTRPRWLKRTQEGQPVRIVNEREMQWLVRKLRQLTKRYQLARQGETKQLMKNVISEIQDLRNELGEKLNITSDENRERLFFRIRKVGWRWDEADPLNAWMLAEWLYNLIANKTPYNTVAARLNDMATLVREMPGVLLSNVSTSELLDIFDDLGLADMSRERISSTVLAFHKFVAQWMPVSKMYWGSFQFQQPVHMQPVITQPVLERTLHRLFSNGDQTAGIGLLFGYFFGLRVSECVNLTIGDVNLDDMPTVFIWRSKRSKNRVVEGFHIPGPAISFLREYLQARLAVEKDDRSAPFMCSHGGKRVSAWQLNRTYQRAICALGVDSAGRQSIAHLLRHSCANRWWVLGMPLVEIAHRLGHASVDTTLSTYLHLAPYFQKDSLINIGQLDIHFLTGQMAFLAGVSKKRIEQIMKCQGMKTTLDFSDAQKILCGFWKSMPEREMEGMEG